MSAQDMMARAVSDAQEILRLRDQNRELTAALEELVRRCDGDEGVRADGSNIQTMRAHAILAKFDSSHVTNQEG